MIIKSFFRFFGIEIQKYYRERYAIMKAKEVFRDKEIVACEVGTSFGKHALQILKHLNIKKLYLIDPYTSYKEYEDNELTKTIDDAEREAHKLLEQYSDKIVWIRKKSDDAVEDIKEKLDFIYIDGNHDSPYVDNDLENYYPLLKKGGMFSGHDFVTGLMDVVTAVNNFSKKHNLNIHTGIGGDWILYDDDALVSGEEQ